ncbi:C11orf57 isoform 5 [Pan troglodytes]|uniref:NKAP domain containing 1 n=3 Tax=Hominidae TaxID=9604 RepID=E9PPH9_HUMAN|nr:NKAP domain containing 1 [Homo sapiens]KAI4074124.1 NKAP domain containing 1 [Homo sapiens]PNI40692.1 C11orf57 isoform 5 [Pan troglodytes]PNJ76009.1 C11orf57 isoform 5 [Pongo abelii]
MSRIPLGKVLLRNVIRHTDAHNKVGDSGGIRYVENKRTGKTDGRCLPGDQKENATQQFKPDAQ